MSSKEEILRKKIVSEHFLTPHLSHIKLANGKSTVLDVLKLKRFQDRMTTTRKSGSGKKGGPIDANKEQKVIKIFERNPNLSVRAVAKKIKMSASFVQKAKSTAG